MARPVRVLNVAEKPSVAKSVAGILSHGNMRTRNRLATWCIVHAVPNHVAVGFICDALRHGGAKTCFKLWALSVSNFGLCGGAVLASASSRSRRFLEHQMLP